MTGWLVEAMVASTALMLLVLAVRRPAARAFGAQAAYLLWALPLLRMLLPPLPPQWREAAAAPIVAARETLLVYVAEPAAAVAPTPGMSLAVAVAALWAAGAALFFARHLVWHALFVRRLLAPPATHSRLPGGIALVETGATPGPVAFGVLRRFVAVPAGFADSYPADERALAIAHEVGHHARGDLIANWIALALLSLHWFNPVAWVAYRAFRADQEMANDARVLAGRSAAERHAYACAIVRAARSGAVSAACHLHSIDDLKGRLRMLSKSTSRTVRRVGTGAVAGLAAAGLALTASGTAAAEKVREVAAALPVAALPVAEAPVPPSAVAVQRPAVAPLPRTPRVHKRVVIVRDGKTTTYTVNDDGDADDDVDVDVADLPRGAVPPVPPAAPRRPDVPTVMEGDCGGSDRGPTTEHKVENGRRIVVICTRRIERIAADAAERASHARVYAMNAQRSALHSLRSSRATIAANRNLSDESRKRALDGIDQAIREIESGQDPAS